MKKQEVSEIEIKTQSTIVYGIGVCYNGCSGTCYEDKSCLKRLRNDNMSEHNVSRMKAIIGAAVLYTLAYGPAVITASSRLT
jgi:hypothetical protein